MPPRRRDMHRQEVRRRIEEAAYRLFAERGYAQTTTAEVAAAAGVSARTLFRYFPAKVDLLFGEAARHTGVLLQAVRERPAAEPALLAGLAGARVLAAELDTPSTSARVAIVRDEPGMRSRALAVLDGWVEELATALADRLDGDRDAARVVATSVLHLLNQAVVSWAQDGARPGTLPGIVERLGAALLPRGSGDGAAPDGAGGDGAVPPQRSRPESSASP